MIQYWPPTIFVRLTNQKCPHYHIVKGGLEVCVDWKELKDGLIAEGISLDFTYKTDGRIKGVAFTCDDISFGGYRIDRTMTYKNIDRKLQTNLEEYNRLIASMSEKVRKIYLLRNICTLASHLLAEMNPLIYQPEYPEQAEHREAAIQYLRRLLMLQWK